MSEKQMLRQRGRHTARFWEAGRKS